MSRYYTDPLSGQQIWEENFELLDNGGYEINITCKPKRKLWYYLQKFKLIKPEEPMLEIEKKPMHGEFLKVNTISTGLFKSFFMSKRGKIKMRMYFSDVNSERWDATVQIRRIGN